MVFMTPGERGFARAVSRINVLNPFLPERIEAEREALGDAYSDPGAVWSLGDQKEERASLRLIRERVESLAARLRESLLGGAVAAREDRELYEDLVLYLLYDRNREKLQDLVLRKPRQGDRAGIYRDYASDAAHFFSVL